MTSAERIQPKRLLAIYLNDHLTGATAGLALARRMSRALPDEPYKETMARITGEIEEDHATLVKLMRGLNIRISRVKPALGWSGEKIGRLKLNGRLLQRSPLSTLLELEIMRLGVEGKAAAWRTLHSICDSEPSLDPDDLQNLIDRAQRQIDDLEGLRKHAATAIFG